MAFLIAHLFGLLDMEDPDGKRMKTVMLGALTELPYEHHEYCLNFGNMDIGPFRQHAKNLKVDFDDMLVNDVPARRTRGRR